MAAEKHLLKGVYMSIRVLFVCHGNICRSPMSEFILKDMVEKRGIKDKFDIASAATSTEEIWNGKGNSIYPPAQTELKKHGIGKTAYTNFSGHDRSQSRITITMIIFCVRTAAIYAIQ